jgi:tripeptide aminopeptidase
LTTASAQERERVVRDVVRYCAIESPSGSERAMADALIADLRELGVEAEEDEAGNLLARVPGPGGAPVVLLCAHLDTVPLDAPVEPVEEDGVIRNRNEAILGADNKAAIATIMGAVRTVRDRPPVGLELLFTTGEEQALKGAKAFDRDKLRADFGYVFDHASPVGELVVAAPTYYRMEARFVGASAHAGIRPEDGHNAIVAASRAVAAMRLGRLDEGTTANAGTIRGGTAPNVVAERCQVELEARSLDDDRASEVVKDMLDAATEAASDSECDLETIVERLFSAYRLSRGSRPVEVAARALERNGVEPTYITTGGGSDANALIAAGLPVLNVANGTQRNHQPDEAVTVEALDRMLDVTVAILEEAAA